MYNFFIVSFFLLFVKAPYANRSSGCIQEFSAQNLSKFTQQRSSESTKSSDHEDGSSRENQETGVGTRESSYGDTEASVKDDKSDDKSTAAADGIVNPTFKCKTCQESFAQKLELSVHYNSATHIHKIRQRAGSNRDSSTPVLAYPYVSTKPYQCDVCHVSYFYAFGLESHLKSVLHQSRTRKAGKVAPNSKTTGIVVANLAGNAVGNTTQIASAKTCNFVPLADKFQLQPASSLLPAPVVSAQTMPTVLPLLTLAPNSVPHTIVPSVFPPPGTSTTQLIPQPQMLMPVLVNGLQTQSATPDGPLQILQQSVPVLGLCSRQQAQGLASSDSQSESATTGVSSVSRIPLETNTSVDGVGVQVKIEVKQEPCDQEVSQVTLCRADAFTQVDLKEEYSSMWDGLQDSVARCDKQQSESKENSKGRHSGSNNASTTHYLRRSRDPKSSPATCKSSNDNLVLIPSMNKPCSSLSYAPPVLTEFQSQVLWAFFESRDEADLEILPKEDCEALSREVGLTEDEVRKWLVETHCIKDGHRADQRERRGSAEDEDDEGALTIDESGGTVLRSTTNFLSDEEDVDDGQITVDKKRKRGIDKEDSEEEAGETLCRSYS